MRTAEDEVLRAYPKATLDMHGKDDFCIYPDTEVDSERLGWGMTAQEAWRDAARLIRFKVMGMQP